VKRSISTLSIVLAMALGSPAIVLADDPPPSQKDLAAAKKAFAAGKAFHEKGKLPDAIEKFKESYQLSKNPLLLYNIALTMEEAGMEDLALFYYRKFLAEAPEDAGQRETVVERVKVIEKKFNIGTSSGTGTKQPDGGKSTAIKPAGTYAADDFQHQLVDAAPPSKPLDVSAFVPEDSGWTVTLFYRTAGEGRYKSRQMKWRYKELVGRIPATKMIGNAVQYYLEVKDQGGTVVTRSGKSTSPNQVLIETGAPERFYPDVSDDGDAAVSTDDVRARDDDDDPLSGKRRRTNDDVVIGPIEPRKPGDGFTDAGSTKFTYAKWGTTATAGAALGFGLVSIIQANRFASALADDSTQCGAPPCRKFDDVSAGYETTGKRWQTFGNIGLGVGIGATVVATYFWYKELRAKKRGEVKVSSKSSPEASSWVVVPAAGDGYTGAAAAVRF
jgi:hypothetical protein